MCRASAAEQGELICRIKAEAKLWASQLRISGRAEVKILLAEVESIKRDLKQMEAANFYLQKQVNGLQESRRETLAQLHNTLQRLDTQAETAILLGTIESLHRDAEFARQENAALVSTMQVLLIQIFFDISH